MFYKYNYPRAGYIVKVDREAENRDLFCTLYIKKKKYALFDNIQIVFSLNVSSAVWYLTFLEIQYINLPTLIF